MASGNLQTIYSWSLTLNNLINVSLMKDPESKYNKYFVFINVAPGGKTNDGNRTYSFKEGINFKIVPSKLYEIYSAINMYLRGQGKMIGTFSIMTDSSKTSYGNSGGMKSMYFNYSQPGAQGNNSKSDVPGIFLVTKANQTINTMIPAPSALVFAEMCKHIFELYVKIDIENYVPYSANNNGNDGNNNFQRGNFNNNSGSESGNFNNNANNFDSGNTGSEDYTNFNDAPF